MSVEDVKDLNKFEEIIKNNPRVAFDFFATWCTLLLYIYRPSL